MSHRISHARVSQLGGVLAVMLALPLLGAGCGPSYTPLNPCAKGAFHEYRLPMPGSQPYAITAGPDKNLWITEPVNRMIWRLNPQTGAFTSYGPLVGSPYGITAGPDGNLWFIDITANGQFVNPYPGYPPFDVPSTLGWINPNTGEFYESPPLSPFGPKGSSVPSTPYAITALDGNIWFTDLQYQGIDKLDPTTLLIIPYSALNNPFSPLGELTGGITAGPDGNIWFETSTGVGQLNLTTNLIGVHELPLMRNNPLGITAGPDGNVWLTGPNAIGRITPASDFTPYDLALGTNPYSITAGPDGNIWFTEEGAPRFGPTARIGTMNPRTGLSSLQEYAPPSSISIDPVGITASPPGWGSCALWFTDQLGGAIWRINS